MRMLPFFLVLSILFSCVKHRNDCNIKPYTTLTQSAKQWFPYNQNGQLIFVNSNLSADTLYLRDFFFGDDEVWNGDECPFSTGQFLRGNIIDLKTADTIQTEIYNAAFVVIKKERIELAYYDGQHIISGVGILAFDTSITLNGTRFNSTLSAACDTDAACTSNGITKFYFARTKGLIAFVRSNTLWTLKE